MCLSLSHFLAFSPSFQPLISLFVVIILSHTRQMEEIAVKDNLFLLCLLLL